MIDSVNNLFDLLKNQ